MLQELHVPNFLSSVKLCSCVTNIKFLCIFISQLIFYLKMLSFHRELMLMLIFFQLPKSHVTKKTVTSAITPTKPTAKCTTCAKVKGNITCLVRPTWCSTQTRTCVIGQRTSKVACNSHQRHHRVRRML